VPAGIVVAGWKTAAGRLSVGTSQPEQSPDVVTPPIVADADGLIETALVPPFSDPTSVLFDANMQSGAAAASTVPAIVNGPLNDTTQAVPVGSIAAVARAVIVGEPPVKSDASTGMTVALILTCVPM
jgi:hypothetical protein